MLLLLHLALSLLVFLPHSSKTQDADEVRLILQELLDGQHDLLARMEELQKKQANIEELQMKQAIMEDQQHSSNETITVLQNMLMTDECEDGTNECSEFATCTDTCGYYKCSCHPGYSGDGFSCTDIDECAEDSNRCTEWGTCENTPGSYNCICEEGFQDDGKTCQDIDECSTGTHSCGFGYKCVNGFGNFSCICQDGFKREEEDGICQDINECEGDSYECDEHASCINNNGSYSCKCNLFYKGNGITCQGPFCRAPFVPIPRVGCIHVERTRQSMEEAQLNCQRMQGRLMEDITLDQLIEMGWHYKGKFEYVIYIGVKEGKWISSKQPISKELWRRVVAPTGARKCAVVDMSTSRIHAHRCEGNAHSLCQPVPE